MKLKSFFAAAFAVIAFSPILSLTAHAQDLATGIRIEQPWIRATVASAPVAGGFALIHNSADTDDRLVGGSASFAGEVQVHEMRIDDGIMKMRQLTDGLLVLAGGSALLKPGSFHLMFMKLERPLEAGETLSVMLSFANAGDVMVEFEVLAMGAKMSAKMGEMDQN